MGVSDKIPFMGGKKKKQKGQPVDPMPTQAVANRDGYGDGNGHLTLEEVVQAIDQRMLQWQHMNRPQIDPESYKDLRRYLYETPQSKMRQLTIRTSKRAALDPWLYMLAYATNPRYFEDEGWGVKKTGKDGRKRFGRRSGDLLLFLIVKEEEINRSKGGFMIQNTVGLTRLQTEIEEEAKHMRSPGY